MKRMRSKLNVYDYIDAQKRLKRAKVIKEYKLNTVETIDDLLNVCSMLYDPEVPKNVLDTFTFDRIRLMKLVPSLIKLKNLIGMDKIKRCITRIIIQFMSGIVDKNEYMLHMAIYGPPGVGKSTVISILAEIYSKLGILSKGHVKTVTSESLIAGYVGQTQIKTKKILESAKGGILLFDEAYSIGTDRSRNDSDGFSKEVADYLNQWLSSQKTDFICIIAGYEDDIKNCFFSLNSGLERRFPYQIRIDEYTPDELAQIFRLKVKQSNGWSLSQESIVSNDLFTDTTVFKHQGGSIENLWSQIQQSHIQRVAFTGTNTEKKVITEVDMTNGLDLLKNNNDKTKEEINYSASLYI